MKTLLIAAMALLPALRASDDALSQTRLRFGLVSTRALANFRAADSIVFNLRAQGLIPRASLTALRFTIEGALDRAEAALKDGDLEAARRAISRAEGALLRLAGELGGS